MNLRGNENPVPRIGDEAIDFCLPATNGQDMRPSDFRDKKSLAVIFFRGTW